MAIIYGRRQRTAAWNGLTVPTGRITNPLAVCRFNAAAYFAQPLVISLAILSWATSPADGYLIAFLSTAWLCGAVELWVRHRLARALNASITAVAQLDGAPVTATVATTAGGLTVTTFLGTLLVYVRSSPSPT